MTDSSPAPSMSDGEMDSDDHASEQPYTLFRKYYRQREDVLTLINQINQLIKVVQKHRGVSMGLLAGDDSYLPRFNSLQAEMEKRLTLLQCFARSTGGALSDREKENLHLAWATIRQDWQDDKLSDNFELHTHFVEQLQAMLSSLSRQMERPLLPELVEGDTGAGMSYPRLFKKIEILNFVARQLPDMIEQVAKVRGLSVYAATAGSVDFYSDRKLRYLLQCAREQNDKLRVQAERIHDHVEKGLDSFDELKNLELKLLYLLNTVEHDVLSGLEIKTPSQQFFTLATEIIDVYWSLVSDGLLQIRRWHEDDMNDWLSLPAEG
ncbi:lytic murein transglycosylase [Teredinibacter haidensis]|uniref:lytic murein transglycosylase n=1 Tax=Teredinibacter haidensis TaxID=2731755 RepID=UPI000948D889|nr:lytic murein transglycosylase [Teredinibacter haidensis]